MVFIGNNSIFFFKCRNKKCSFDCIQELKRFLPSEMLNFRQVPSCSTLNFFQLPTVGQEMDPNRWTLIDGVFCGSEVVEQYRYTERFGGKGKRGNYLSACEKPMIHET